jgi:hypothetical protein
MIRILREFGINGLGMAVSKIGIAALVVAGRWLSSHLSNLETSGNFHPTLFNNPAAQRPDTSGRLNNLWARRNTNQLVDVGHSPKAGIGSQAPNPGLGMNGEGYLRLNRATASSRLRTCSFLQMFLT